MASGAWRTIVRDNASDARVLGDLERLAAAYGPADGPGEAPQDPAVGDAELLASAYGADAAGPSEPLQAAIATHIRRNRTAYGVAAALVAVLALVDPVAKVTAPRQGDTVAFGSQAPTQSAVASTASALPGPTGIAPQPAFEALFPVDPATFAAPATFESSPPPAIPPSLVDLLDPLRIVDSGYASVTGGTPLEQPPPGDGLPVTAAGPIATRFSFVRLAGTAPVLTLRLVTDSGAGVNESGAAVSACKITDPTWTGERGVPLSEAPPYDANGCVAGAAGEGGVWNFDLSARGDRADPAGFALVPSPDAGAPFQVVFSPVAS